MAQWANVPMSDSLNRNVDEAIISNHLAALENAYVNEASGQSRFPPSKPFAPLTGAQGVYLSDWRGDLIAATDTGRVHRVTKSGTTEDLTGVPISGPGRRVVFDRTEDELVMAAGGPVIALRDERTEILSSDAPNSTHVAFIDGYLLVFEPHSGRFSHSDAGLYRMWNPQDTFTAEAKPDNLVAMTVSPYRELLLAGPDSIEQWERATTGAGAFYRRWTTGEGLFAPYTLLAVDDGTYGINRLKEFVRFSNQVSRPESDSVEFVFARIPDEDWVGAWTAKLHIKGQKFIVLSIPGATNSYGSKGVTALFDYRARRWSFLYDWDQAFGVPTGWRATSYHPLWGRHFIGVPGGIEELDDQDFAASVRPQRFLVRSGHIDKWGPSRIDDFRLRIKRGLADSNTPDDQIVQVGLRINRDDKGFTRWKWKKLGRYGDRSPILYFGPLGSVDGTWQFELAVVGTQEVELVRSEVYLERIRW